MRLRAAFLFSLVASSALLAVPPRIVFDTDMCGDYDDVGALAVLNALADAGECEFLGVVSSSRRSPALGMCEIVNAHYGRTNLPMGVCREIGVVADPGEKGIVGVFRSMIAARKDALAYPNTDAAPDANDVYRRLLADSPDGSVVLCTVGFLTNVRRLLETAGDAISPFSGRELVARKVKAWYAMGGALPVGRECNLREDAASAAKAIADSPVPIRFIDFHLGADVLTGLPVARQGIASGNPVAEAYVRCMKAWGETNRGRPSWDPLAVLAAVRGGETYFDLERGTMRVDPVTGSNAWTRAANGAHHALVEKTPKAELRAVLDELMARPPRRLQADANAKPFVWWHWCGTAVTKTGIVRDLDAMADSGIGGATIFQVARGPCSEIPAYGYADDTMSDFEFGNERWWEFVAFAVREAKKRGLEIGMHNSPGYTVSGGPWVKPEDGMKKLVWSVAGVGETPPQPETNLGFYRDIGTVEKDGKVFRFGYTLTGAQCMPVARSLIGRCLEADKMSARAIHAHLDRLLARDVGLDFILMDSYEAGDYDWTDDFRAEFMKRRGYDPLPELPAYVGAATEGAAKIKADMARTVQELSTERHYGVFRDRLHARGVKFVVEPYGGPFDRCEAAWASDLPMTEFWGARPFWVAPGVVGGSPLTGGAAGRAAGRTVIAAEAYTAMPFQDPYVLSPRDFKACTDATFARGINRMNLHHWVHQPFPACRKPGMNMGYWGAHFGVNATWYEPAKAFIAYLTRCQEKLQRGEEVIDVLAVEDFRGITDGVDVVPRRVFKDGVFFADGKAVCPSGRSYPYLAVPRALRDDPIVAEKLARARRAGVTILADDAPMPKRPFSVVSGVAVDANGPVLGTARRVRQTGSARSPNGDELFFFVANVSTNAVSFEGDFRIGFYGQPELYYPATGETEILPFTLADAAGFARLPLTLGPQESVFVFFGTSGLRASPKAPKRRPSVARALPVAGPWTVTFEKERGAPPGARTFDRLVSWTESSDFGIRHFSGTVTYRTRVTLSAADAKDVFKLALGEVRDIARVRLNGKDLGVAWYAPFAVLTGDAARAGENVLEIEVTNGWHNRLIGDRALPDDCAWGPEREHQCALDGSKGACGRGLARIPDWAWRADGARPSSNRVTFTSWDYFSGGESLRPSGLLGPVSFLFRK